MQQYLLMFLLASTALFLIVLVLVQRGKGGGLAGAFGGMGGQSAFGTKAGDLFTKVTIIVAVAWILLCVFAVWMLGGEEKGPMAGDLGKEGKSTPGASSTLDPEETPAPTDE